MFEVGQKIECIDASPVRSDCATVMPLFLVAGAVYTVRSIHIEAGIPGYGVRLDELHNPSVIWSDNTEAEWSYDSRRFRPASPAHEQIVADAIGVGHDDSLRTIVCPHGAVCSLLVETELVDGGGYRTIVTERICQECLRELAARVIIGWTESKGLTP